MATCKNCDKKGLFLKVDSDGLCDRCGPVVGMNVRECARLIESSIDLVTNGKTIDTRLSRIDFILEKAKELVPYEAKGIPTISPPPSQLIRDMPGIRAEAVVSKLSEDFDAAKTKADLASTPTGKVSPLAKVLENIEKYRDATDDALTLRRLEVTVREDLHRRQVSVLREKAEKLEFKGQQKKAVDAYLDLLFFLRNDEIDDAEQSAPMYEVEQKIIALGGSVPG